jgi:hypothetical protein
MLRYKNPRDVSSRLRRQTSVHSLGAHSCDQHYYSNGTVRELHNASESAD